MRACRLFILCAVTVCLFLLTIGQPCQAATAAQRKQVVALRATIRKAGGLFKRRKFADSADLIKSAQSEYERLSIAADAVLLKALIPAHKSLDKAHALLELEGFTLPPLPSLKGTSKPPGSPTTNAAPAMKERIPVTKSRGNETVSFAGGIAPVLAEQCLGCHGSNQPRANLNMSRFDGLLRGGDRGPPALPGKPQDSLLVNKLRGTAGARMPLNRPALPDEVIKKFETWIEEGATFDGDRPNQDIRLVAALYKARNSSHEELARERMELAKKNWQLAMPDIMMGSSEHENVVVIGRLADEARLREIGELAEAQIPKLAKLLRMPADRPAVKGRSTLYYFQRSYDYGEFGQMVEQRDLSSDARGHWRFTVVDAYGAIMVPASQVVDDSMTALVTQQLAGIYAASIGKEIPDWFADGLARACAARVAPQGKMVLGWQKQFSRVMQTVLSPRDIVTDRLPPEEAGVVRYGLMKDLMRARGFPKLLTALRSGTPFNEALQETCGATAEQLAGIWLERARR